MTAEALVGCLLGTAVGDALGLPYEGLSPERARRLFHSYDRHHLLFGRGMVSDDTDHACFTAGALLECRGELAVFRKRLSKSLRCWLLGLPAGVGLATLRSILNLWMGWSPQRSGIFSAGNGPAMRSPILGVALGDSPERLDEFLLASTQMTHTDPKAYCGALAMAWAAHLSAGMEAVAYSQYRQALAPRLPDEPGGELMQLLDLAAVSAARGQPVSAFASSLGSRRGISGYMYHTAPCIVQAWLRYPEDYAGGVKEVISAGGDTDTTAAILGGIIGARVGKAGIPGAWLRGLVAWPRGVNWMEELGSALAGASCGEVSRAPTYFAPGVSLRNALLLAVVLFHGLRRLAPPY